MTSEPTSDDGHQAVRRHGFHPVRVKQVVDETSDTRSFALDIPDAWRADFAYRAGQFVTFRVHLGDGEHLRSYSMSSAPAVDTDLTVTVKRVPGGLVSNWLNDHLGRGQVVDTTRPAGVFCAQATDRPMVAFCGGSGVTPVMSITKEVLATTGRTVWIFYANRHRQAVIFGAELADLAARHPGRLELRLHFDVEEGLPAADQLATFASASPQADFYICGPGPFMELVETTLHELGVGGDRIWIERFVVDEPTPAAATQADEPGGQAPTAVTIVLEGRSKTMSYRSGDSVLETARRGGLQPPFSCQAGDCATCMALLKEGSVTMRANNALTPEEVEEGWILTCQAVPTTPTVTVEYESL